MPPSPASWVDIGAATTPAFSKDGTRIFHLRGAGLPQVWVMDRDGTNARALSAHDEKVAFLRRAPNDDRLLWGIDAGGDERQQFWLLDGAPPPRALTEAPAVMHDFGAFSPDGARIAYAANDRDESHFDVLVMDLATGISRRVLEATGQRSVGAWNPHDERVTVIEDHSTSDQRLHLLDLATGEAVELPRAGPTRYASVRWTSDGTGLMGLTDHGGADFMRLCRIDPATGDATPVFAPAHRDVEAWSLSSDGTLLATVENDRGYGVLRAGVTGTEREAVAGLPHGVAADLAWSPDGTALAFTAQSPVMPPGLWLWTAATHAAAPLFQPTAPDSLIDWDLVGWPGLGGVPIAGWFAKPAGKPAAAGFPAVVWVHGGPASQTRPNWRVDMQLLLSQGYAVLLPNIRGSTGYGRAFMESDDVGRRPDCLEDLAAGHAWLAAQPGIDASRIGIMGQSYGGWVVLAAVTLQPTLWKAAIDYYGIADFVTLLEHTGPWRRDHRAREYGFPGTDDALFARISPIHHVAAVTAPMLLLHGDRDPRVPMEETDQFAHALEQHQKKVRTERFTYAGHGFIRPDHRRRVYTAVTEHFAEHL